MAGALVRFMTPKAITYELLTSNVVGGQLLAAGTAAGSNGGNPTCVVAGANSQKIIGIAATDAVPASATASYTSGTAGYDGGFPVIDASVPVANVAVYNDVVATVTYAAAAAYRVPLKSAANGQVTPWVSGTDTDPLLIIGWCAQPGGVSAAGAGLARILV